MAKDKDKNAELIGLIDDLLQQSKKSDAADRRPVDIITFCESPSLLNLLGQNPPIELWPMQKCVLKLFYRGTRGNEHIQLTQDELDMLEDIAKQEELDYNPKYGGFRQVIQKYHRGTIFKTLQLVMGRRSSKTFMVSVLAAYEAYKLMETPEGNPQKYYNMAAGASIAIVNAAVSEKQAYDPLFLAIQTRITTSPYFQGRIGPASKKGELYLLTDADIEENKKLTEQGVDKALLRPGGIVLICGNSNSASIRGKAAIAILLDEFAHFQNTDGRSSGDEVYSALAPSCQQFGDDGKIVLLSDPEGKEGMYWKLFEMSQERTEDKDGNTTYPYDNILSLQLPTWRINPTPNVSKAKLEVEVRAKDPLAFTTSYAARFVGAMGSKLLDGDRIDDCVDLRLREATVGNRQYSYYVHIDPATTSHNYALVMVHPEHVRGPTKEHRTKIVVDLVKFWTPNEKGPVNIEEIEKFAFGLFRRFRVVLVTFDSFQSASTMQRFKKSGVPCLETQYNPTYMTEIYGELRTLIHQGDLTMYPHEQLRGELKGLMYKIVGRGIKVSFDPKSEFPSDDCADALAGATYQALHKIQQPLPRALTVRMPLTASNGWSPPYDTRRQ